MGRHDPSCRIDLPVSIQYHRPPTCIINLVKNGKTSINKGEGLRSWSPEEAAIMKRNYEERLKAAFAVLKIAPDED
jgi:3-hydroxybutyryl-CoA dehydrogenase